MTDIKNHGSNKASYSHGPIEPMYSEVPTHLINNLIDKNNALEKLVTELKAKIEDLENELIEISEKEE